MIAYCGLDCSQCGAYQATRLDNDQKRAETAKLWSQLYQADIKADQINCTGCKSKGVKFSHCSVCEIRECCISRGIDHCAACDDYICDKLSQFIKLAPEAGTALEQLRI